MPTPITAARGTGNVAATQLRIDMAQRVLELEPSAMPLLVLSKKAEKRSAHNPKFQWHEDELEPRFDRVNGTTGTGTSVVVDNGPYFGVDDLVLVSRTGELMRVTAIATNTLTVVRAVGDGASAVALVDNDELIILSSAAAEGATSQSSQSINPTAVYNYTQIFRDPIEMTETMRTTDTEHTPHDWERQRNRKGIEHGKSIEFAFLFGKPGLDTSGTHPRRATGGFQHYLSTTNNTDAGGALTEAEFFAALRPAFRYGSKTKLGMCAALVTDVLNGFPRGKLEVQQHESPDTFGLGVFRYRSPHGTLNIVTHWLLEGDKYANEMFIVDLSNVQYRYLQNQHGSRDTSILKDRQAPDADTQKEEYLSECGLQFGLPRTHAKLTNVTS
jgi:hypothetical protein